MTQDRVQVEADVEFGTGGGRKLQCDIYRPPRSAIEQRADAGGRVPGVLLLHGGSWRGGDRTQLRGYGIQLGRAGYLCVASEYRLIPETEYPGFLHDAKAAVRWMRAEADQLGIDPGRIGVQGNSAGGHLALLLAGTSHVAELEGDGGNAGVSSAVQACVAVYAPTVFTMEADGSGVRPAERLMSAATPELAQQASPLSWAAEDHPPTLLIHGDADTVVPVAASRRMYDALRQAGAAAELRVYSGQPHAFDNQPAFGRHLVGDIRFFFDRFLSAAG